MYCLTNGIVESRKSIFKILSATFCARAQRNGKGKLEIIFSKSKLQDSFHARGLKSPRSSHLPHAIANLVEAEIRCCTEQNVLKIHLSSFRTSSSSTQENSEYVGDFFKYFVKFSRISTNCTQFFNVRPFEENTYSILVDLGERFLLNVLSRILVTVQPRLGRPKFDGVGVGSLQLQSLSAISNSQDSWP